MTNDVPTSIGAGKSVVLRISKALRPHQPEAKSLESQGLQFHERKHVSRACNSRPRVVGASRDEVAYHDCVPEPIPAALDAAGVPAPSSDHSLEPPEEVLAKLDEDLARFLADPDWSPRGPALFERVRQIPIEGIDDRPLTGGFVIADELGRRELPYTEDTVAQLLGVSRSTVAGRTVVGVALLWADLRRLVDLQPWNHPTEIRGVLARLTDSLEGWPDAWRLSAEEIVRRAPKLGAHATDLLVLAAIRDGGVRSILSRVSRQSPDRDVRDRGVGILARVEGVPTLGEELRRWVTDSASRIYDGYPLFPHPLTPLARTWLGSLEVEETIAHCIEQATGRFAQDVRDQGGKGEEPLTEGLLKELEFAFRATGLRLEATGNDPLRRAITVSHRPVAKMTEEPHWGCDVALLVRVDIDRALDLELATLVQVKKYEAAKGRPKVASTDAWRIDVPQMLTLLSVSDAAVYWLMLRSGEVDCVPAHVVHAIARGRSVLGQGSFTLGYNDIRHGAVRLHQFLPELVLGAWIGSSKESTLRFAHGEDDLRPRHIIEIGVAPSHDG